MAAGIAELESFVRECLAKGIARKDVGQALQGAGWTTEQIESAMLAFADVDFPVPVPRPRAYLSAREAFVYLLLFSTLYLSGYHTGSLLFDLIDKAFPDAALRGETEYLVYSIRWSISSLIIAFPTFLFLSHRVARDLARNPVKRLSAIRRWLTYLTLFGTACIIIGDLIALVYNLLGGELTVRFALKVLVVGAIAGTIFGYYLWDLRQEERQ